jgi:hypothetical protein
VEKRYAYRDLLLNKEGRKERSMSEETQDIDYKALYEQVIAENEGLREQLTRSKLSAVNDTVSEALDGFVLIVKQTDPMRLYIWVCIAFLVVLSVARMIEVLR